MELTNTYLGSVGVIIAGTLILLYDLTIADLLVTIAISGYILYQGFTLIGQTIRILMESVPEDINLNDVLHELTTIEGVRDVHHLHIWQLGEHTRALEAHLVTQQRDVEAWETIKRQVKERLKTRFEIDHSTLEFEPAVTEATENDHDRSIVPEH